MLERLSGLEEEYESVVQRLSDPGVFADPRQVREVARRRKQLEPIVAAYRQYRQAHDDLTAAKELLPDAEGDDRDVLRAEVDQAESTMARLDEELKVLLLPKDPNDGKNVIVEIRGAEGGEEANLFAKDLFEMYVRH